MHEEMPVKLLSWNFFWNGNDKVYLISTSFPSVTKLNKCILCHAEFLKIH